MLNDSRELSSMNMYNLRRQQGNFNKFNNHDSQYSGSGTDTDSEIEEDEYNDRDVDYDDDNEDEIDDGSFNRRLNASHVPLSESFRTAHSSPIEALVHRKNIESLSSSRSFNVTNSPVSHRTQNSSNDNFSKLFIVSFCIIICVVLCIVIVLFIREFGESRIDEKVTVNEHETREINLVETNNRLIKSVDVIRSRFKNQRANIWNDISAGIYDTALFPTRPSIIILFGNETETLNCLAQLLAEVSSDILGSNDHLTLMSNHFPDDVGQVIDILKERIIQKKAIVIQDLFSINTQAIRAFHNFCDREKPLVGHAIYIITIIIDGYKASHGELRFVEQQMYKRLRGHVDKDNISPLITRLTDGVVAPILPEPNIKFDKSLCSLKISDFNSGQS